MVGDESGGDGDGEGDGDGGGDGYDDDGDGDGGDGDVVGVSGDADGIRDGDGEVGDDAVDWLGEARVGKPRWVKTPHDKDIATCPPPASAAESGCGKACKLGLRRNHCSPFAAINDGHRS